MRIADLNWMQLESYLEHDDRIVLPLGSTEQHAYLSLCTDNILAERVAVEAAEPLGVPVLPVLSYGYTRTFVAYPGSVSLRLETLVAVLRDIFDSLYGQGFRRFVVVNGHGGNTPADAMRRDWVADHPDAQVLFHNWWVGRPWQVVEEIDPVGSHASWTENFPWTRLEGVELPDEQKPLVGDLPLEPSRVRAELGDGSYGGVYQRADEEMLRIWQTGVEEVRELIATGWS